MPDILQVPVPNGKAAIAWSGRQANISTILFYNTDVNNTVWLGSLSNIVPGGAGTIPILPNGTFSGDPSVNWYVTGSAAGIVPLVVVPNGQGYFLGITAGLGNLVIPSVQSPNFVHNVSGWQIAKDGSAEFNDLTIRGTFFGTDFEINSNGIFFYSGTPAAGNLILSIANSGGVDSFGNVYPEGYGLFRSLQSGGAQIALTTNAINQSKAAQLYSYIQNTGLVNELYWLNITGPQNSNQIDYATIFLGSSASDASADAKGFLSYIDSIGGNNTEAFWDCTGLTIYTAASITAVKPGTGTSPAVPAVPETWHTMTLANGWANVAGSATAKYRKIASPPNTVEIAGSINAAAATAATFFNLPAGYRPANPQPVCSMGANGAIPAGLSPWIKCDALGNLTVQNTGALGAWQSFFHGFVALDA